jgi:DNA-binding transcriptional MerR regulator
MRISELAATTGVSTPTIKWYLRIGLLPRGEATARNQADYGAEHVHRLRLIRALLEVGGLSVADAQRVLAVIDDPTADLEQVMRVAHGALSRAAGSPSPLGLAAVDAMLERRGWRVPDDAPARAELAAVLSTMVALEGTDPAALQADVAPEVTIAIAERIDPYAVALDTIARDEVRSLPADAPRDVIVERMILGTVLVDRLMGAVRRLAQEHWFLEDRRGRPGDGAPR